MHRTFLIFLIFITQNCFAVTDGNIPVNIMDELLKDFNFPLTFIHLVLLFLTFSIIYINYKFKNQKFPDWLSVVYFLMLCSIILFDKGTNIFTFKICIFLSFIIGISFFIATYIVCFAIPSKRKSLKTIAYFSTLFIIFIITSLISFWLLWLLY